jgi:arylsulfatase A-like enzyme
VRKERRYGDYPQEYDFYDPAGLTVPDNVPLQFRDFARKELADYYGMVTSLDDCMGRLLRELDELGLSDDTIVCFSSDHGDHLNAHGMGTPADLWMHPTLALSKATPYDESIHVPFILRYPRAVEPLRRTYCPISSVDVLPTLLGLCGLAVPADVQGTDLSHVVRGEPGEEPDSVYLQILGPGWPTRTKSVGLWRGVRTRQYLYARWWDRHGRRVLYDRRKDPLEMRNVVDAPEYAEAAAELEARLQRWMQETRDPFDTGERLPATGMLDLGQAFIHTLWHEHAPPDYVAAIAENHKRFATGDQEYLPPFTSR